MIPGISPSKPPGPGLPSFPLARRRAHTRRALAAVVTALVTLAASRTDAQNRYEGFIAGRIFTGIQADEQDETFRQDLYIAGIRVDLKKKGNGAVLATGFTDDTGRFEIPFDHEDNDARIEVYVKVFAETENETIRVRSLTGTRSRKYFRDDPIVLDPATGISEDFGEFEVDSRDVKPQLLHWANRCMQLVEAEAPGVTLNHPLDIRIPDVRPGAVYFVPGLIASGPDGVIARWLGVSVSLITGILFSRNDCLYIGADWELRENTVYHEFGHYLMWNAQGEQWVSGAGFATHNFESNNPGAGLAWTEGFATGFAMVVDAWSRQDDGESGHYIDADVESRHFPADLNGDGVADVDLPPEDMEWTTVDCSGASTCCDNQILTHGFFSEFSIGALVYDLWDGANNLQLNGNPQLSGESHEDSGADQVELTLAEILKPLLDGQSGPLVENVVEYQADLQRSFDCAGIGDLRAVLSLNGIQNLENDLDGLPFEEVVLEQDLPDTDAIWFERLVEVDTFNHNSDWSEWTFKRAEDGTFRVDVSALLTTDDDFNLSSVLGVASGELSDDLRVMGLPNEGSAQLSFNGPGLYGWQSAANRYGMPAGTLAAGGNDLEVSLCGNMTLEVDEGGEIVLGDPTGLRTARVVVQSGSTLILGGGTDGQLRVQDPIFGDQVSPGKLTIHDRSRLVVERGATLVIERGAMIELDGPGAVLDIRGDLQIVERADFTYWGGGYTLFDLPDLDEKPNLEMGPLSRITLAEVRFDVAAGSYVRPPGDTSLQLIIEYANGNFGNGAFVDVAHCTFTLRGSNIVPRPANVLHRGFIVRGFTHTIDGNRIEGVDPGFLAIPEGTDALMITDTEILGGKDGIVSDTLAVSLGGCLFSALDTGVLATNAGFYILDTTLQYCDTGLETQNGAGTLDDARFQNCGIGWLGIDVNAASEIRGGSVRNCAAFGYHLVPTPGSPAELSMSGVTLHQNEVGLRVDGGMRVRVRCSTLTDNRHGFEIAGGAALDISQYAYLDAARNDATIHLDGAARPILEDGYNTLTGGQTIEGTIDEDTTAPGFSWTIQADVNSHDTSSNPLLPAIVPLDLGPYSITDSSGLNFYSLATNVAAPASVCAP